MRNFFARQLLHCLLLTSSLAVAQEQRCNYYNPIRSPWFGDLHVHTALSLDASMQGTRTDALDAYRFARGEAVGIPPYTPDGKPLRSAILTRPLDFAAVTDHAETLGVNRVCATPGMEGYQSLYCVSLRRFPRWAGLLAAHKASRGRGLDFCGEAGELCQEAGRGAWTELRAAAELAYDRSSDCAFTSFVGYEWTGASYPRAGFIANLHRNVIFRNAAVPSLPPSFIDADRVEELYRRLDTLCRDADIGCDALMIPHNSNLSMGMMFPEVEASAEDDPVAVARARARYEPLAEIIQHKGSSECYFGRSPIMAGDELCAFEQLPWNSFTGNSFPPLERPAAADSGFLRAALHSGLRWQAKRGVNPYQFGFVGGTDSHRSLAGAVEEDMFQGHGGAGNAEAEAEAQGLPDQWEFNPGGLTVLYAEQNDRESLFEAMRRRESYATSGPRMVVRFFGGAELPSDFCERGDALTRAYEKGVPMGGELSGLSRAPFFAVSALKDPGTLLQSGGDLQRVQIIKGWVDERGESQQRIYEVAGDANSDAEVDLASCEPRGEGHKSLCTVWRDPDFQTGQLAFYYARVLENPSCRWSTRVCNAQRVDCSEPRKLPAEQVVCCSSRLRKSVQERAWTSPIWVSPAQPPSDSP